MTEMVQLRRGQLTSVRKPADVVDRFEGWRRSPGKGSAMATVRDRAWTWAVW